jgi:hypothetical protein
VDKLRSQIYEVKMATGRTSKNDNVQSYENQIALCRSAQNR